MVAFIYFVMKGDKFEKSQKTGLESQNNPEKDNLLQKFIGWLRGQVEESPVIQAINGNQEKGLQAGSEVARLIQKDCKKALENCEEALQSGNLLTLQEVWEKIKVPFREAQDANLDIPELKQVPTLLQEVAEKWQEDLLEKFREIEDPEEKVIINSSGLLKIQATLALIKSLDIEIDTSIVANAMSRLIEARIILAQEEINILAKERNNKNFQDALRQELTNLGKLGADIQEMRFQLESLGETTSFIYRGKLNQNGDSE